MTHYDDETLAAYALDRARVDDPDAVEKHLGVCISCREEVEAAREFDALSREVEMWDASDAIRTPRARLTEAMAQRNAIVAEEMTAHRLLAPYLKSPLRLRNKKLADDPRFWTAGVVRMLCVAARGEHERRPRFSRALAAQACEIAARLDPPQPECAVQAYCERANALRYLGKFKEAERALAEAERLLPETPVADFDAAVINYIRATVWIESERAADAVALAQASARTFHSYGDHARELAAVMAEGTCLLFLGEARRAAHQFEHVISLARRSGDIVILARALNNAALAYERAKDLDRATAYYTEALALYEEMGIPTETARTRWSLAIILVERGDLAQGIYALDDARVELAAHGLTNDAALATLDWAQARMAAGISEGVAKACAHIMMTFGSEGMDRNARLALAYLHEALAAGTATTATVRHVREYLGTLPAAPDKPFASPS